MAIWLQTCLVTECLLYNLLHTEGLLYFLTIVNKFFFRMLHLISLRQEVPQPLRPLKGELQKLRWDFTKIRNLRFGVVRAINIDCISQKRGYKLSNVYANITGIWITDIYSKVTIQIPNIQKRKHLNTRHFGVQLNHSETGHFCHIQMQLDRMENLYSVG